MPAPHPSVGLQPGVSALFIFYALIASLKFGESETAGLFSSWAAAYLCGAVLLEPGPSHRLGDALPHKRGHQVWALLPSRQVVLG